MQPLKKVHHYVQKNTRLLSSIFLSIVLFAILSQIYIVNDLPTQAKILQHTHLDYTNKLKTLEIQQQKIKEKLAAVVRNKEGIESSARYQLGFIKDGEKYYNFPNK